MCEPNNDSQAVRYNSHNSDDEEVFLDANDTTILNDNSEHKHDGACNTKIPFENYLIINDSNELIPNGRKTLPNEIPPRQLSIWSCVKEFVGRDLTRITMPIFVNEPLSFMQRISENFLHHTLMQKIIEKNPIERLEYLAANYAVFQSPHAYRTLKPFNPLLGETYELRNEEKGFYFVAEQVSHHPPITAFYIQTSTFRGHASLGYSLNFWGNRCDMIVDGLFRFEILDSKGEVESLLTFGSPVNSARNIIIGNMWIEKHGIVEMVDHSTGCRLSLNFKKKPWLSNRDQYAIEGTLFDVNGNALRCLYGHWTQEIWSCSPETYRKIKLNPSLKKGVGSKLLGKAIGKSPNSEYYFNLPQFSICLNEIHEGMNLPRTDSRLRPDIRFLEEGNFERASAEKHRLEEKQRATRRNSEAIGERWVPRWFALKRVPISNKDEWVFTHKYFEQNFEDCPDIF